MAKTEMIRARVEPDLKDKAEEVFDALGLTATEAITLFYKQVSMQHGMPFAVKVPNADTRAAIQEAHDKSTLTQYDSVDDLMNEFDDA